MPFDIVPADGPLPPHARESAPWTFCGDRASPDFGTVFAHPAARGGLELTFDRAGHHHALTHFDASTLGDEVVIHGRRFDVVRVTEAV